MAKYIMPLSEREVHITWDEESKTAKIFTTSPAMIRKLDKMVDRCPEAYSRIREEDWSGNRACFYQVPAKLISFRTPAAPRQMSDEQRRAASERFAAYHLRRREQNQTIVNGGEQA